MSDEAITVPDEAPGLYAETIRQREEIARLKAEAEMLRQALKPFADAWTNIPTEVYRSLTFSQLAAIAKHTVSGVHFSRAAAAFTPSQEPRT